MPIQPPLALGADILVQTPTPLPLILAPKFITPFARERCFARPKRLLPADFRQSLWARTGSYALSLEFEHVVCADTALTEFTFVGFHEEIARIWRCDPKFALLAMLVRGAICIYSFARAFFVCHDVAFHKPAVLANPLLSANAVHKPRVFVARNALELVWTINFGCKAVAQTFWRPARLR